ncbi:unnamed protein product [Boreogadus saida]
MGLTGNSRNSRGQPQTHAGSGGGFHFRLFHLVKSRTNAGFRAVPLLCWGQVEYTPCRPRLGQGKVDGLLLHTPEAM